MAIYELDENGNVVPKVDDSETPVDEGYDYTDDVLSVAEPPDYAYEDALSFLDDTVNQNVQDYEPASVSYDLGDHPIDDPSLLYDPFDTSHYTSTTVDVSADNAYWAQFGGKPTGSYDPAIPSEWTP